MPTPAPRRANSAAIARPRPVPPREADSWQGSGDAYRGLARQSRLQHPDARQLGGAGAHLVHPDVVAVAVAAVGVVAEQQVGALLADDGDEPLGGLPDRRAHEADTVGGGRGP